MFTDWGKMDIHWGKMDNRGGHLAPSHTTVASQLTPELAACLSNVVLSAQARHIGLKSYVCIVRLVLHQLCKLYLRV